MDMMYTMDSYIRAGSDISTIFSTFKNTFIGGLKKLATRVMEFFRKYVRGIQNRITDLRRQQKYDFNAINVNRDSINKTADISDASKHLVEQIDERLEDYNQTSGRYLMAITTLIEEIREVNADLRYTLTQIKSISIYILSDDAATIDHKVAAVHHNLERAEERYKTVLGVKDNTLAILNDWKAKYPNGPSLATNEAYDLIYEESKKLSSEMGVSINRAIQSLSSVTERITVPCEMTIVNHLTEINKLLNSIASLTVGLATLILPLVEL